MPVDKTTSNEQAELITLLTSYGDKLRADVPELADKFENPAGDDQIEALNRAIQPLRLPEDVATLYKWQNGFRPNIYLFGYLLLDPIEYGISEYGRSEGPWSRVWFPISSMDGFFRLVLLSEEFASSTPVYSYHVEEPSLQLEFESVRLMVKTYYDAHEAGHSKYYEKFEQFEFDEEAVENIRLELNPASYSYPDKQQNCYDIDTPDSWPPLWQRHSVEN
jgi:hypothetical protein